MPRPSKYPQPQAGDRYGKLTVLGNAPSNGKHRKVTCKCDCGSTTTPRIDHLRQGATRSCGCERDKKAGDRLRTHGDYGTPLYRVWQAMRNRVYTKTCTVYPYYGGRGINIHEDWAEYEPFRDWSLDNGYQPSLTIDRIDVNGDYSPDNCRWITLKENMNNRRTNNFVTVFNETKTVAQWSEDKRCRVKYKTLWRRLNAGWNPEMALTAPLSGGKRMANK